MKDEYLAFQFHYGTIKSYLSWCMPSVRNSFQFHYGTIKSPNAISTIPFLADFNSTMVRLKEVSFFVYTERRSVISIPLWYD